jgi:hypothetical protein
MSGGPGSCPSSTIRAFRSGIVLADTATSRSNTDAPTGGREGGGTLHDSKGVDFRLRSSGRARAQIDHDELQRCSAMCGKARLKRLCGKVCVTITFMARHSCPCHGGSTTSLLHSQSVNRRLRLKGAGNTLPNREKPPGLSLGV